MASATNGLFASIALLAASCLPAFADDCSVVTAASIATAQKPYSTTISRTGKDGKPMINHAVHTTKVMYIEINGKWMSMQISSQDQIDTFNDMVKSSKIICQKLGTESVNGQAATIYTMHVDNKDRVSDNKLWISAAPLILKTESHIQDSPYPIGSTYDYDHIDPPADAKPLGTR